MVTRAIHGLRPSGSWPLCKTAFLPFCQASNANAPILMVGAFYFQISANSPPECLLFCHLELRLLPSPLIL